MKSSRTLVPASEEEAFVRAFDLREVDADPPTFWTRKWWARANRMIALVERATSPGGKVLDVGCAQGNLTNLLAERGYECVGVDLRASFLRHAGKKSDAPERAAWVVANAEALPFAESAFDVVILGEIIEHVAEPHRLMAQALQGVRPGGTVICTTPNGACFRNSSLPSYEEAARDLDDLRARQYGPAGADHLFAIRPDELLALAPEGTRPRLEFVVSAVWNRYLGVVARWAAPSAAIEWLSMRSLWRRQLADGLIVVLRRPGP